VSKKGLGKGLQALIRTTDKNDLASSAAPQVNGVLEIPIDKIKPNSKQPRRAFDEDKLEELAQSVREYGVVQPIIVRKAGDHYEIVAGERRWRACQKIGLTSIPAIIKKFDDQELTEIALIENIQREDLNPIEEALAYRKLIKEFGLTQEELAKKIGKSVPFISNMRRLLNLPEEIQEMVEVGSLTIGHARALLAVKDPDTQLELANKVIKQGLSVRDIEKIVNNVAKGNKKPKLKAEDLRREPIVLQFEEKLRSYFGTQVKVKGQSDKGKIEIDYYSEEDLNRIIELFFGADQF